MQAIDWQTVLRRVPCHLLSLRKGASLSHLTAVEARLHESLPTAYREFLLCSDGGWVGDIRLYGTDELAQLLHPRAPGTRPWPHERRLLPFHPVDRYGVECIDLDRNGHPIVWCRTQHPARTHDPLGGVHPLATRVAQWQGPRRPAMDDTYLDFLDWAMDMLFEVALV